MTLTRNSPASRPQIGLTALSLLALVGLSVASGSAGANAAETVVTPVCPQPAANTGHALAPSSARDVAVGSVDLFAGVMPPGIELTNSTFSGTPNTTGMYTFAIRSTYPLSDGTNGHELTTCSMQIKPAPTVSRVQGADRYVTALELSRQSFATANVAYVVSGEKFADALSASGVAGINAGPILLTRSDALPDGVVAELTRLGVKDIALVGGPSSISENVRTQLLTTGATVNRISGADRFATSRSLLMHPLFGNLSATAPTLASGLDFPDALSAGPAAVRFGQSMMLVDGHSTALSDAEKTFIAERGYTSAHVVGGPNSVTPQLEQSAMTAFGALTPRVAGASRYDTSVAVNAAFPTAPRVYLASGTGFADALSGGAAAGYSESPLMIVPSTCVPQATIDAIYRIAPSEIVVLGGTSTLSAAVANLTPCA